MNLALGDLQVPTINRNPVIIEAGVSSDLIEEWFDEPVNVPEIVVNASELGEYSFDVITDGAWYPVAVGQDQYQIRTGSGVDSAPWTDTNGRPVLVSLYRLNTAIINQRRGASR